MGHPCSLRGPCRCSDPDAGHAAARSPRCRLGPGFAGWEMTTPAPEPSAMLFVRYCQPDPTRHPFKVYWATALDALTLTKVTILKEQGHS